MVRPQCYAVGVRVLLSGLVVAALMRAAVADPAPLHQTIETKRSRAALSERLVAAAQRAVKARDWPRAIPLYRALVVARGPGSPEAAQLATAWTLAGQLEQAAEAWSSYAAATGDAHAIAEAKRLSASPDPLADKLVLAALVGEARVAFAAARRAFAAKQYGDALVLFHVGHALAPDAPGFVRELAATYDKLAAADAKRTFLLGYLRQRPLGANADSVRALLVADPVARPQLGTLLVTSSLPCTELWLNRQRLGKLPAKGFVVPSGTYKGLCFSPKHEMALFEYATVEEGRPATMAFRWAIVENRLVQPLGRIALENPKAPGIMIDLGITTTEIGVAAPADGRKLKMILKDDTGARTEQRMVEVQAGQRLVVRW